MIQVVVVEGNRTLAKLYLEELSEAGFAVRVRPDLEQALLDLRHSPAHILVADQESAGSHPRRWLERVRRVHAGPLLVLAQPRRLREPAGGDWLRVEKKPDLSGLIASLKGQTAAVMWTRAAGSC